MSDGCTCILLRLTAVPLGSLPIEVSEPETWTHGATAILVIVLGLLAILFLSVLVVALRRSRQRSAQGKAKGGSVDGPSPWDVAGQRAEPLDGRPGNSDNPRER